MHHSLSITLLVVGRHIAKTEIEQGFVCNIPDPNLFTPVFRIRILVELLSFDYSLYNNKILLLEALLINFPLNILNFCRIHIRRSNVTDSKPRFNPYIHLSILVQINCWVLEISLQYELRWDIVQPLHIENIILPLLGNYYDKGVPKTDLSKNLLK